METLRAPFYTLPDLHGDPLVDFAHYPAEEILYLRWHGHITAEIVIRVAQLALAQQSLLRYHRVLNDKSVATGDWSEALPWLQYEWLPKATAGGLRAMSYVFSPDLGHQLVSREFVTEAQPYLAIELFRDVDEAWQWLLAH